MLFQAQRATGEDSTYDDDDVDMRLLILTAQ